jgi:hypothetical protein
MKLKTAGVFVLLSLSAVAQRYFPDPPFYPDFPELNQKVARHYGKCLARMGELPLPVEGEKRTDEAAQGEYRFLWYGSFGYPVLVVRISVEKEGWGAVHSKVLARHDECSKGAPREVISRRLKSAELDEFLTALKSAEFWDLSMVEPNEPSHRDGAEWIIEGSVPGNYKAVRRWSPKGGAYHSLGKLFLNLGGLQSERVF